MEHYPKVSVHGEIMPSEILHRGGIRTISDEILRIQDRHKAQVEYDKKHGGWTGEPMEEIEKLQAAQNSGLRYILRLPRVNEGGCVRKYGPVYDKTKQYHEFIETLARRSGIPRLQHLSDSFYVLESQEDAKLLRDKLTEHQERAGLEFEVIENDDTEV